MEKASWMIESLAEKDEDRWLASLLATEWACQDVGEKRDKLIRSRVNMSPRTANNAASGKFCSRSNGNTRPKIVKVTRNSD